VPPAVADRYALELQALAASLTTPASDDPTVLTLDPQAGELLLGFERDLEPRLAAGSGCTGALGLPVAIRDPRPVDMDGRGNT
jgi:hypothetical protein